MDEFWGSIEKIMLKKAGNHDGTVVSPWTSVVPASHLEAHIALG